MGKHKAGGLKAIMTMTCWSFMEGLPAPGPEQILGLDLLKSLLSIKRRTVQSVRQEEDVSEGMEE